MSYTCRKRDSLSTAPGLATAILKIVAAIAVCALISSCSTIKEIRENKVLDKIGSFELNPVTPDSYWYNGASYEYNSYEINITSSPVAARIIWDGKYIGDTPLVYPYTGTLDKGDKITIRAIPIDGTLKPQESFLKIVRELPRKIHFKLQ